MKLMQVISGRAILWPESFTAQAQRFRGAQGYVVDLDAPCEAEWCAGQHHKLEPAPEGAVASAIESPIAKRAIEAAMKKAGAAPPAPAKPAIPADLPSVDLPNKRAPAKV